MIKDEWWRRVIPKFCVKIKATIASISRELKVREEYCIVDIFEGSQGSIRVRAYDDRTSREYRKFS